MNKGTSNPYSLLLQDETEADGIGLEEEEEEDADAEMNGMEEDEDDDDDDDDDEEEEETVEDSDEEEIFSSSKHRSLSHEGANLNGQNHLGHGNEYRLLNNNESDFKTVIDTPITIWTPTPMSPARRACFIASIMFGVLMVATFLWVLPCDVQPCEGEMGLTDNDWAVKIEGMGINQTKLVRRLMGGHNVLLSYYTSSNISGWQNYNSSATEDEVWKSDQLLNGCNNCGEGEDVDGDHADTGDGQCGLLMLDGNLGREIWRLPLRECPVDLQCDLLDVSGDHIPDCIVRGGHSMVFMIEARHGTIMWHLHQHKVTTDKPSLSADSIHNSRPPLKLLNPGSPVLIPDINNDTYGDLLISGILSQSPQPWNTAEYTDSEFWSSENDDTPQPSESSAAVNNVVLVCGQSGSMLGNPFVLKQCQRILALSSDEHYIHYTCLPFNGSKYSDKIHLSRLLNQILGDNTQAEKLENDNSFIPPYNIQAKKKDPCKIKVFYNKGICPNCKSKITFVRSDGYVMWERPYEHTGVVSWATLISNEECHGAIIKVWEYKHITTVVRTAKPSPVINRRTTRSSLMTDLENVETEPTDIEQASEEKPFIMVLNSNFSEGSQMHTLLHKTSLLSLKEEYGEDSGGNTARNGQPPNATDPESSRSRREFQEEGTEKLPDMYEHPTIHRHKGKQVSGIHDDDHNDSKDKDSESWHSYKNYPYHPKQISTTASIPPAGMRTMPPDILAPPGYQLQHIHERIIVLTFNGTHWMDETLTSMGISQLCHNQNNCIPDMKSHCKSVAVNPGIKENVWQLVTSSSTFVNTPISGQEAHSAPWTLTSLLRKIIVNV